MKRFTISYWPEAGTMAIQVAVVTAPDAENAEMKFYSSKAGRNCADIIEITPC